MTYWNLEAQAEADLRYPPDHEVEDPFGETGVARSDKYGYDEMANRAFMQGVEWQASRKDAAHDAEVARKALLDAADEIERIVNDAEVAETVAFPPGTVGLGAAIDRRDRMLESPEDWLRARAEQIGENRG